MNRDILMQVLKIVVMVVTLVITRYVIPYLKAKTDTDKLEKVLKYVCQSVKAAEQVYGEKEGEKKKKLAIKYITTILGNSGIDISEQEIDMLIEAAVHTMNNDGFIGVPFEEFEDIEEKGLK